MTQIFAWGSSYYLPAVLAHPIADDMAWSFAWVIAGLSLGLVIAGLVSPLVGRVINRTGGRSVLTLSSALLGAGLLVLGASQNLPMFFLAWLLIGVGMGAGLYDAAFGVLGRLYLRDARRSIAALTLFGGFASTICWPLSALMLEQFGWRGVCFAYAAIQLCLALPMHWFILPTLPTKLPVRAGDRAAVSARLLPPSDTLKFVVLAAAVTLASVISAMVSVHLLTMLQDKGLALAAAVALGAMVGPSQVGARLIEITFGNRYHPIWTKLVASLLVTLGLALLYFDFPILALPLIIYGAGIGIASIARGTLPLAIFEPAAYAAVMGRLAMPSLVFQAIAPFAGAVMIQYGGSDLALAVLLGLAGTNVLLVSVLMMMCRPLRTAQPV